MVNTAVLLKDWLPTPFYPQMKIALAFRELLKSPSSVNSLTPIPELITSQSLHPPQSFAKRPQLV